MDSIHGQIHGIFTELIQFQSVDLHHQIEGSALGLLCETHPHLGIHIGHDHLAVLVGEGDPEFVVALFDPVEPHPGHDGAVGDRVGDLGGGHRVEGAEDADFAAIIDGRVTEGKDFEFQRGHHDPGRRRGKARADDVLRALLAVVVGSVGT